MPSAPSESLSVGGRVGIVAFPVAFVVLCFATSNLVLAFYAMVTIGLIVASVLGTVPRRRPHCYFFDRLAQRQRVRFQS